MTFTGPDPSLAFTRHQKVIAVVDVVESVRLMELDEHDFIQRWHRFVGRTRSEVLPRFGGRMHKSLGDGLMLEFPDARQGVGAVLALQALCRESNAGIAPTSQHMQLRAAAHLATFVSDEYDIYGTDVNLAARLASVAGPGEVVVSSALRDELTDGLDADVEDLGDCHLKHVSEPVRVYRVGPAGRHRSSGMRRNPGRCSPRSRSFRSRCASPIRNTSRSANSWPKASSPHWAARRSCA